MFVTTRTCFSEGQSLSYFPHPDPAKYLNLVLNILIEFPPQDTEVPNKKESIKTYSFSIVEQITVSGLKKHKFITLQFGRSEAQIGSHRVSRCFISQYQGLSFQRISLSVGINTTQERWSKNLKSLYKTLCCFARALSAPGHLLISFFRCLHVLVHLGCQDRPPDQTRWLTRTETYFSQFWRLENPGSRCCRFCVQ